MIVLNPYRYFVDPLDTRFGAEIYQFDASDPTTLRLATNNVGQCANGDPVARWNSKGTGLNLLQATLNNRPIYVANQYNGKGTVRFDGINDQLDGVNVGIDRAEPASTWYVVTKGNLTGTTQRILFTRKTTQTTVNTALIQNSNANRTMLVVANRIASDGTNFAPTVSLTGSSNLNLNITTIIQRYNSTGIASLINNGIERNTRTYLSGTGLTANVGTNFNLGGDFARYSGDVCEILIYNGTEHTDEQRRQIESYLFHKWWVII
jgi:hypothetical protein